MTAINARLAYAVRLQEQPDPRRRSASGSWSSHGFATMEIVWMTPEELHDATRPIGSAFIAKLCLRQCARAA
jgi:hypothetical protein